MNFQLRKWFRPSKKNPSQTEDRLLTIHDEEDAEIPRYPPFAKGIPASSTEKVLTTQAELIEKIRYSIGFDIPTFNRLLLPIIRNYAEFVHLLPASESHHHRGAGGLFRHGLEVAFWSTQASESVIFSVEGTPKERRDNEPCWRFACCIAGLLHDVGKPISDVLVTNRDGSDVWNPYSQSIIEWVRSSNIDRYFIRWRDKKHKRHEQFSLLTVDRIVPTEPREYLSWNGPTVIEAMLEAISGTSINQPVSKLVLLADKESVSRDISMGSHSVEDFAYGLSVERYVCDAIRRLIQSGKWKVNVPGARVWYMEQGVFVTWKNLDDVYEILKQDKTPGIPRAPDTLADILIERGYVLPNIKNENGEEAVYRYWNVRPECLQSNGVVTLPMLRFETADLVFSNEPPSKMAGEVEGICDDNEISFSDIEDSELQNDELESRSGSVVKGTKSKIIDQDLASEAGSEEAKPESDGDQASTDTVSQDTKTDDTSTKASQPPTLFDSANPLKNVPAKYFRRHLTEGRDTTKVPVTDEKQNLAHFKDHIKEYDIEVRELLEKAFESPNIIQVLENQAVIEYPDAISLLGSPSEVVRKFEKNDVLIPDPVFPSKLIQSINGKKYVVLTQQIFRALTPEQSDEINETETDILEKQTIAKEVVAKEAVATLDLMPTEIDVATAIRQLKEMILRREGKWLLTPVTEENGYLVTSADAFDLIAGENVQLSKHALGAFLNRSQGRPLLTKRAGKLYLEMEQ